MYACGANGTILHDNGAGWTASTSGTVRDLYGVFARRTDSVYAVGDAGTILHYAPSN
jgi:photosystem II stability/assembly factor-like uncharacterized protein